MGKGGVPLVSFGGYRDGGEDAIRGAILPGESTRGHLLEWQQPPFALYFPKAPPVITRQASLSIVPTDSAIYFVGLKFDGVEFRVSTQSRLSYSQISAVSIEHVKRVNTKSWKLFGQVEQVVLLSVWSGHVVRQLETRYVEGLEQGRVIETLVREWEGNGGGARSSLADELEKLAQLRASGVITSDEWDRAKDLFLGKAPDIQQQAVLLLGQLYNLHKAGALSDSEFRMKKWDILAKG